MSGDFKYQLFVAASGNLGGKVRVFDDVLSSHKQEFCPTTSIKENCIDFELETDWNYYVDLRQAYFPVKLNFFKGRGYEIYITKKILKKRAQRSGKGE